MLSLKEEEQKMYAGGMNQGRKLNPTTKFYGKDD